MTAAVRIDIICKENPIFFFKKTNKISISYQKCIRLPFNWKSPIGYPFAVTLQCVLIIYLFLSLMLLVTIGLASYLFGISLAADLNMILRLIDENSKTKSNRLKIFTQFKEFINFHSAPKMLSKIDHLRRRLSLLPSA